MIADAMKVRLRPGDRAILERRGCAPAVPSRGSCCGYGSLLEATDGHATREIARELETTPTTVSLWRIRYAREGLDGLEDRLRSGTPPIYGEATDQRIRTVLDQRPPKGFARWNGPLMRGLWATSMCSMFGCRCASGRSICPQKLVREQRSGFCGKGRRCGRSLFGAAQKRDCSLC